MEYLKFLIAKSVVSKIVYKNMLYTFFSSLLEKILWINLKNNF